VLSYTARAHLRYKRKQPSPFSIAPSSELFCYSFYCPCSLFWQKNNTSQQQRSCSHSYQPSTTRTSSNAESKNLKTSIESSVISIKQQRKITEPLTLRYNKKSMQPAAATHHALALTASIPPPKQSAGTASSKIVSIDCASAGRQAHTHVLTTTARLPKQPARTVCSMLARANFASLRPVSSPI
jgi:hypothetical protein